MSEGAKPGQWRGARFAPELPREDGEFGLRPEAGSGGEGIAGTGVAVDTSKFWGKR